jgi:hypothetical protein
VKPVFVDRTGQRRRLVKVAGVAAGLALAAVSLLLLAGFTGTGPGHLPLLPEPVGGAPGAPRPSAETRPVPPSPAPVRTSASQPVTAAPTAASATPTPSRSSHRRVPTHTPGNGNKPSKPS